MASLLISNLQTSFFAPVGPTPRDDVLRDYMGYLALRNGNRRPGHPYGTYERREDWLRSTREWKVRHAGELPQEVFDQNFTRFDPTADLSAAWIALLAFVKVNAGENYGVEVTTKRRHRVPVTEADDLANQVERLCGLEEMYHTKILLGATEQFGLSSPTSAWQPPVPIKLVITGLAHSSQMIFHPVLLAAEYAGVFIFNWLLTKVGEIFCDEKDLRDSLEERLIEVLVDEIGHVAFNRMMVGQQGMKAARWLAPCVMAATATATPEFGALGWTSETVREFKRFDLDKLPEEARRRAFYA